MSKIKLKCQECGTVYTKRIGHKTVDRLWPSEKEISISFSVQCPKCKGFDVDLAEEVELEEENILTMIQSANEKNPSAFKDAFEKAIAVATGDALTAKRMEMGTKIYPSDENIDENGK